MRNHTERGRFKKNKEDKRVLHKKEERTRRGGYTKTIKKKTDEWKKEEKEKMKEAGA